MIKTVWVIQSNYGFLDDIEHYTKEPEEAITFSSLDTALYKLTSVADRLSSSCWVAETQIQFPRRIPIK